MALLSKQSVLSVDDFQYALVPCPEWGGEIRVRGLTAAEQAIISKKVNSGATEELAIIVTLMGCVDENGERIFDNGDKELLKSRSYVVLDRIAKKILELSGAGDPDSIEGTKKN